MGSRRRGRPFYIRLMLVQVFWGLWRVEVYDINGAVPMPLTEMYSGLLFGRSSAESRRQTMVAVLHGLELGTKYTVEGVNLLKTDFNGHVKDYELKIMVN